MTAATPAPSTANSPDGLGRGTGGRRGYWRRCLEWLLVAIVFLLAFLIYRVPSYNLVVLNLFFLPVVLAAFFLGRYEAGVLAFLAAICVGVLVALDLEVLTLRLPPAAVGFAVLFWGAVLGMTALLVGTLSEERSRHVKDLHEARVGVADILVRYLQNTCEWHNAGIVRIAQLCQRMARELRLSDKEVENIRIAVLLQDLGNIETTARAIRKVAADQTRFIHDEPLPDAPPPGIVSGGDRVRSFENRLNGALQLLLLAGELEFADLNMSPDVADPQPLLGARVLMTVRAFAEQCPEPFPLDETTDAAHLRMIIEQMEADDSRQHDPIVLGALKRVLQEKTDFPAPDAAVNAAQPLPVG